MLKSPKWDVGPRYQLIRKIGKGTYGSVFEARDTHTNEKVAIKNIKSLFENETEAKYMIREICIMTRLKHQNIVKIKDLIFPKNNNYSNVLIVMELAESDLKKLTKSPSYLNRNQVRLLMYQAICGCRYMHSAYILHRDLKPANILINSDCSLKICDFGLSRSYKRVNKSFDEGSLSASRISHSDFNDEEILRSLNEKSNMFTGHIATRWYRPPEVILMEKKYGKEIDVWSLGCVFAEMLGMMRENVPKHVDRNPLFTGNSCYPLSPDPEFLSKYARYQIQPTDQLNMIFNVLGSNQDFNFITDVEALEYVKSFPFVRPRNLKDIFPGITINELDLLTKMLSFSPKQRITLDQAIDHPYFSAVKDPNSEKLFEGSAEFHFEADFDVDVLTLKELFHDIVNRFNN